MKKIYLMVLAICMMAGTLNAQKAYIRLGVGGGVGLKQYEGGTWADETHTSTSDNLVIKSMGLGSGFNANLAFGFMFSKYVGVELGINEFIGLVNKIHGTSTNGGNDNSSDSKLSGMMLQIVPAIVITPGLEKLNPYARFGMSVGILPSVVMKNNSTFTGGESFKATSSAESNIKLYGGIALGFTAAGGIDFNLSEKLAFFGEFVFNGITYAPAKGKYTKYTVDGVDKLATMTTRDKEWTFEKKYDVDEVIPEGSPAKQPKMSVNFSNVELNIGIKFKL
jgi:hypothetical protein